MGNDTTGTEPICDLRDGVRAQTLDEKTEDQGFNPDLWLSSSGLWWGRSWLFPEPHFPICRMGCAWESGVSSSWGCGVPSAAPSGSLVSEGLFLPLSTKLEPGSHSSLGSRASEPGRWGEAELGAGNWVMGESWP